MGERDKRDLATEDVHKGLWDAEREIENLRSLKSRLVRRCTHKNKSGQSVLLYQEAGQRYDREYWSCATCGGGQSYAPVEPKVKKIFTEERSFYQYVDAVARLMTMNSVDDVIDALPSPFKAKFLDHARECFLPKGERYVIGQPLPDEVFPAFRDWQERHRS
jgi:hypothetical protein